MQAQLPPGHQQQQQQQSQQHQHPYHTQQSPQTPYSSDGIHSDTRHSSGGYGDTPTNGIMNPYQQYAGGYAQHPQYSQQQQQQQSQQQPQQQRPFMPTQLPPLGPAMSAPMPPVRASPTPLQTNSANNFQPPHYAAGPQPMSHPQSQPPLPPPAARATASTQPHEKKMSNSSVKDGLKYSLQVVQQPQRARMCGFGDKDRRPITPPPCVRLVIMDLETNREIDVNDIQSDPSFFVLQVDLWAESADREASVVRASSNSPAVSISSATTTSYPPPAEHPRQIEQPLMYVSHDGQPVYAASVPGYAVPLGRPGQMMYPQHPAGLYYPHVGASQATSYMPPAQTNSAMYTRNLIGSLTVNASRLTDNDGKVGYWFVLQDLSVRTEGFFRLRMSFIDISNHGAPGINKGKAPVLAWTFSDKFQVYSAKKFPGVIESTPLSKCFASQGIKIPIRKDNKGDGNDDDDGD